MNSAPASPPLRATLLAVAVLFILLVALRLHGFSLPMWHDVVELDPGTRSSADEILLGAARMIRSDDWMVQLPLAFAQRSAEPAFPLVNQSVGLGTSMLVPVQAPVAHPLAIFQPRFWGFFLGNDLGTSWLWWHNLLGLFATWLLVFHVVSGGRILLSALGAALLVSSPFFAFWSFNAAPLCIYAGLGFVAMTRLLVARTRAELALATLLLGAAAGCFALAIYPPYQVGLTLVMGVLIAALVWQERRSLTSSSLLPLGSRLGACAIAALIAAGVVGVLYLETVDVVSVLRETSYPGQRVATGGDRSLWSLFTASLGAGLQVTNYGPLDNVAEAASFMLLWPPVSVLLLWRRFADGEPLDGVATALSLLAGILTLYITLGFPEWLARITLMSQMPGGRALLALGIADALLLIRFVSLRRGRSPTDESRARLVAAGTAVGVAFVGIRLVETLPELSLPISGAFVFASAGAAYFVCRGSRGEIGVAILLVAAMVSTLWFNPLVRGGSEYLFTNPLSARILEIDRESGGNSVWLTYGSSWASNLFRVLGIRNLNGIQPVPQAAVWERLDADGSDRRVWNRYANVFAVLAPVGETRFELTRPDAFTVHVSPDDPALRELSLSHFLVRSRVTRDFDRLEHWERVDSIGEYHIYALKDFDRSAPTRSEASLPLH